MSSASDSKYAPVVPEAIADDLLYAFAHGWIVLPLTAPEGEASERLTRLYSVQRFAQSLYVRGSE